MSFRQYLATSDAPMVKALRKVRRSVLNFTLPAPKIIVKPALWLFLGLRSLYYFGMRVFICEPLFKAYCTEYGRGVQTGVYVHWVMGKGKIILGDSVLIDGKCSFSFAARFVKNPTLTIGSRSGIGHGCSFTVGKRITIGEDCRIAGYVWMFDTSGHPSDPEGRAAGLPMTEDDVRPITIGNNVWIGGRAIIFPGVTVGSDSIVAAGAVVLSDVPPNTIVAGNPARKIGVIKPRREESQPLPAMENASS